MRTYFILIAMVLLALTPFITPVHAAISGDVMQNLRELENENNKRPWRNGSYESLSGIVGDRVLDETNHVIGSVRDVVLSSNGSIEAVDVNVGKLRVASQKIQIDYRALGGEAVPGGYKFGVRDSELDEILPLMLAQISPSAGGHKTYFSAKSLVGVPLHANGDKIGTIHDVLFDSLGRRAQYVLVRPSGKGVGKGEFVVPFSSVTYEAGQNARPKASLENAVAGAVDLYLQQN